MFRKNQEHLQIPLFSSINELPEKLQKRLEESWGGELLQGILCADR